MLKRIPIRTKLIAALTVPMLTLVGVSAVEVAAAVQNSNKVHDQVSLARAAAGPSGLLRRIQNERNDAATVLVGLRGALVIPGVKDTAEARGQADSAYRAMKATLKQRGSKAERLFAPALAAYEKVIPKVRTEMDDFRGPKNLDNAQLSSKIFTGGGLPTSAAPQDRHRAGIRIGGL